MVKIDAEGFDLRVLAGASDLLSKTGVFFGRGHRVLPRTTTLSPRATRLATMLWTLPTSIGVPSCVFYGSES